MGIEGLAARAGVSVRTVRYYIAEGLLPGPSGRGKAAAYDDEHLARLRLIRQLVERRVPLSELKARVTSLGRSEVEELLRREERAARALQAQAQPGPSPRAYVEALLRRTRTGGSALAEPPPAFASPSAPVPAASVRNADAWRHWTLAPGVELQVRTDAAKSQALLVERLLRAARDVGPAR